MRVREFCRRTAIVTLALAVAGGCSDGRSGKLKARKLQLVEMEWGERNWDLAPEVEPTPEQLKGPWSIIRVESHVTFFGESKIMAINAEASPELVREPAVFEMSG